MKTSIFILLSVFLLATPGRAQNIRNAFGHTEAMIRLDHGLQQFSLHSDIPQLSSQQYLQDGGSLSLVIGNKIFKMPVQLISFYDISLEGPQPLSKRDRSVGLEVSLTNLLFVHTWPRLDFYVGGRLAQTKIDVENIKFNGNTGNALQEARAGWVSLYTQNIYGGISYRVVEQNGKQVKIFAEIDRGFFSHREDSSPILENTTITDAYHFNFGVQFGLYNLKHIESQKSGKI